MAVYNEILAGRFNRFVQKLLSMKGPTSLVAVSSDLRMTHQVQSGAECRYIEGWDLFGISVSVTAAAANFSTIELRNPTTSGIVGVLTRAFAYEKLVDADGPFLILIRGATADQPTVTASIGWDQRSRPASSLIFSSNPAAAATAFGGTNAIIGRHNVPANTNTIELLPAGLEVPILPGQAIAMQNNVAAQLMAGGFWWRERPLEDSEKF